MVRPVLQVIAGINRGGAENHLVDLVRHLRSGGQPVSVAYLSGDHYWRSEFQRMGAEVYDLGLRAYGDPVPVFRLRAIIKQSQAQIVHAHLPPAELYTRLALTGFSEQTIAFLITKHADRQFYFGPGHRSVGRWVARRARRVIAISDALKGYLTRSDLQLPAEQVTTVRYSLDVSPFLHASPDAVAQLRKEWNAGKATLVIGTVARLNAQKSLDTLIDAFAQFSRQCNCDTRLVIVGRGPLEKELKQHAEGAGVANRVVWAGFREDIPVVMSAFDIFALPSVYEGFGLVLLEAMAARRPIVATRISSIPEIVVDGETGFLVPTRQPEALANALLTLQDPKVREAFGEKGLRRVVEEFPPAKMFAGTERVYEECLAELKNGA